MSTTMAATVRLSRFSSMSLACHRSLRLYLTNSQLTTAHRYLSCSASLQDRKPPHVKTPGKVKLYAEKTYLSFMGRMERKLESRFPKAHKLYVLVKQGMKTFFSDTKTLYRVSTEMWKGKKPTDFSYLELEVYQRMPGDMLKVFPVLAIAALPFAPYVIFPVAYLFPRHLLCQHFWTDEQHTQFGEHYLKARAAHYPKVLHYMERHSRDVQDPGHRRLLEGIIHKLEQKSHPSVEEIVAVKPVFRDDQPFGRIFLSTRHKLLTRHLAKSLDLSMWTTRMSQQALLLHHTDVALIRHGVTSLTPRQCRQACFVRGINAAKCSENDMQQYLQTWTEVSKHTDESTLSLLLHSPVLLALNHPANASLIKS